MSGTTHTDQQNVEGYLLAGVDSNSCYASRFAERGQKEKRAIWNRLASDEGAIYAIYINNPMLCPSKWVAHTHEANH
jgi:hypothetical protein